MVIFISSPSFTEIYITLYNKHFIFCHRLLDLCSGVDEEKFFNWKNKNPALPEVREEGWK